MIKISPEFFEEIPQWDVALEALLREEYSKRRTPLTVKDVHALSVQYEIRFDDMMRTLFELTVQGRWRYLPTPTTLAEVTRADMDALWSEGRLTFERAAEAYSGGWRTRV